MFGRIRVSSSSPESLERPPSKIFKDDPLSIYEATLMKLKLGSQRELSTPSQQAGLIEIDSACAGVMEIKSHCSSAVTSKNSQDIVISPHEEVMAIDAESSSGIGSPGSIDSHSPGGMKQRRNGNVSLLYLFSKFKNSCQAVSSSGDDTMAIEDACSASISTNSSDCQSLGSMELQMDQQCVSSLPLCQM